MDDLIRQASASLSTPAPNKFPNISTTHTKQGPLPNALGLEFDVSTLPTTVHPTGHKPHNRYRGDAKVAIQKIDPNKDEVPKEGKSGVNELLFDLKMKKNAVHARIKTRLREEEEMLVAGPYKAKMQSRAEKLKNEEYKKSLEKSGINPERYAKRHQTQDVLDLEKKYQPRDQFNTQSGFDPSDNDFYRSFLKRSQATTFSKSKYEADQQSLGCDFYAVNHAMMVHSSTPTTENIDQMVDELGQQQKRRDKYHRKRAYKEERDITYINEENKQFNRQLGKHYDKYTVQIKESLERGTAL